MHKKILVTESSMPPFDEYINEIKDLWQSHWLTNMGEKHKRFERELTEFLEVPNISLMTNGHMALELVLQAMELSGEVITTPFTFASTTHAIVRNGLTPVFCDIKDTDYTIDAEKIEHLITDKTVAIVPVHVYGNVCDVEKIQSIAKKHRLKVVYDAAHAFGERYKDIGIGNFGDASIFSFHATKVFHSIEGGAVSFSDAEMERELYGLKNFGIRNQEIVDKVGTNAKMNEFQAAMGICNLRHIEEEVMKRKHLVERYILLLENVKGITICKTQKDTQSNYSYFPIRIDKDRYGMSRDDLYEKLKEENIFVRKYFYPLTNEFECYKEKGYRGETPIAMKVSKEILTLPLYANLKTSDVNRICNLIGC